MERFYLEYKILENRVGLLGDVASLMGMLGINIIRIGGIPPDRRCFLLEVPGPEYLTPVKSSLGLSPHLELLELHPPNYIDFLTMRHGRKIYAEGDPPMFHFQRQELPVLVDFLGETIREKGNPTIGIQGPPRVGKTEVAIAACVHANKKWILFSTTFIRQLAREALDFSELDEESVIIIDALTSLHRAGPQHRRLLKEVMEQPQAKIIEHPGVFVEELNFEYRNFDALIFLKRDENGGDEEELEPLPFNQFDIS